MTNYLKREIGLLEAIGIGLGAVIGAGIFVVTGVAAGAAGPSFLLGLVLAGVAATCNGLSSAQLAARYPQAGGTYEYGYRVLHPLAGFSAGWMFLASKLSAGGVVALGFGNYLNQLFPVIDPQAGAFVAVLVLTIMNLLGIKKAGRLNLIIVSITILALLYFVISGLPYVDIQNLSPFAPNGIRGIGQAAALLFFAFTGYARITTLGEEVRKPEKTIPKAIILTLSVSFLLYLFVAFVAVSTAGASVLSKSGSPLDAAARFFSAPGIIPIIGIGATTAMLGVLLSQILGTSRMFFAMARKGDMPKGFKRITGKAAVPVVGVIVTAFIVLLLVLIGQIEWIAASASFTILMYYSLANLSVLIMEGKDRLYPIWISWLGLISCLIMAVSMKIETIISGLGLLLVGYMFRFIYRKTKK